MTTQCQVMIRQDELVLSWWSAALPKRQAEKWLKMSHSSHRLSHTLPFYLTVSKICTQCEMEHKADGIMEQMCSSDFGKSFTQSSRDLENSTRAI